MQTWQLAILMGFMYWVFVELTSNVVITHCANLEDPLLTFDEKYLDDKNLGQISRFVNSSEMLDYLTDKALQSEQGYAMDNWARFNVEGMRKLCYGEDLRILCAPFINDVRIEGTNTFVLKMLVQLPMNYNQSQSYQTATMGFLGVDTNPYVDDRWKHWIPQTVNFLHVQVPTGIVGGDLQVWEDKRPEERELGYLSVDGPAHISKVTLNSMHAMRGDSYWTFTDFDLPNDGRPDHERRRVSIYLAQYTLSKASYTETKDMDVWAVPEPSIKVAVAFGTTLFALSGAAIGVAASQKQQKEGNVAYVVVCVFIGFAVGAGIGFSATMGLGWSFNHLSELFVIINEWCHQNYVISPTVTVWFLLTLAMTAVWTVLVLGGGYVWRLTAGEQTVDEASESLKALIQGESAVSMKESVVRKKMKEGKGTEKEQVKKVE